MPVTGQEHAARKTGILTAPASNGDLTLDYLSEYLGVRRIDLAKITDESSSARFQDNPSDAGSQQPAIVIRKRFVEHEDRDAEHVTALEALSKRRELGVRQLEVAHGLRASSGRLRAALRRRVTTEPAEERSPAKR